MSVGLAQRRVTAAEFLARIAHARCCAAITVDQKLDAAIASQAEVLFILRGNGLDLASAVKRVHDAGKLVAVHLDLIAGLRADRTGVAWLAKSGADAIISSHGQLMAAIKQEGAVAIQRLLLVRQSQMHAAVAAITRSGPDIVEVLPGVILPDVIHLLPHDSVPLLAGGFIRTESEARAAVAAGAVGVTTSWPPLWDLAIG